MTSVHSAGPSMQVYSTEVTLIFPSLRFLFIFGTAGNVAVLTYVFFVTRSLRSSVTALGNTFVYMVVLSGVDLLVTMSIPFHLSELSNKICSSFILTALGFDRYMAICHPEVKRVHQMRQTAAIVTGMICISAILITPVVFSAY
ncbi:unnamed protein product, partial [Mesorhabditis belari]|uniref:G-protein coupled receptors family 1 profile domain-containing protein n=1 Tax=Mesorhabditis belari TaxID=2138241 RepID=A0AAF3F988_9BILA